ncbi:hypothetical protein G9A89_011825 [Geosiphon pyriformis]|nr:hypothetical protein G9A89_011825 [Geosiphon pyriformis]
MKPTLPNTKDIEKKFDVLKSSLVSLVKQISELAKRLESFMLVVSQPSSRCQLLVIPPSQNQMGNIVIKESSGETTGGKTAVNLDFSVSSKVKRLKNMLEKLSALVLSLIARFDGSILAETKLKEKICLWIVNKFDDVCVFTSGLNSGYLGAGIALVIDNSLAKYICKIFEMPVLAKIRKSYHFSKMSKSEHTRDSQIRLAIDERIESFELNKSYTIKSVLECSFCKITLDHLVANNKLVLDSDLVKTKVNIIMEA